MCLSKDSSLWPAVFVLFCTPLSKPLETREKTGCLRMLSLGSERAKAGKWNPEQLRDSAGIIDLRRWNVRSEFAF